MFARSADILLKHEPDLRKLMFMADRNDAERNMHDTGRMQVDRLRSDA